MKINCDHTKRKGNHYDTESMLCLTFGCSHILGCSLLDLSK